MGLLDAFDTIADGTDIARSKPNPEAFLVAAKRICLDPSEYIVIEDAFVGIDAAIAGGFLPIAIDDARNHKGAAHRIDSLGQLLKLPELR